MAAIGTSSLDGDDDRDTTTIAFWLKSKSASNVERQLENGWVVSIRAQQDVVVATTKQIGAPKDLIESGRDAIDETLDLVCFRRNEGLELKAQSGDRFVLAREGGKRVLTYRTILPWKVHAGTISITVTDADGKVRAPTQTSAQWQPVLRYYRLSQTREDIFDAYRYMFLAFEALLFSLWPLIAKPREHEWDWLLRAVGELGKRINLTPYVPIASSDLTKAFVESQYAQIRLPLFHAKKSSVSLPHEGLAEDAVAAAYSRLTRLVRTALNEYYGMQGQSAVLTNYVFQSGLTGLFETKELCAALTLDNTPYDESDERFSPKGLDKFVFDQIEYEPETNSGTRLLTATLNLVGSIPRGPIYRIGLLAAEKCLICSTLDVPINLDKVDQFRFELLFTFINLNTPKWT